MSDGATPLRHPACTCPPGQPEGSYSVDCEHHVHLGNLFRDEMIHRFGSGSITAPVLTIADLNDLLDRRSYKPGWTFTIYEGDTTKQIFIRIHAVIEDSYNPGQQVALDIRSPIPGFALESELAFDKWLAWRLGVIELHESAEWYKRPHRQHPERMTPVFNPHADGADRDQWPIVKQGA